MPPWPNCLLLIAPLSIFNGLFTGRLPQGLYHDRGVPPALLVSEHALRVLVFVAPLWLPLSLERRDALILFAAGAALYLLSWTPALADVAMARRLGVYLLPHTTPLIWLLALAWMGASWPYAAAGIAFVVVHTAHGILAHKTFEPS